MSQPASELIEFRAPGRPGIVDQHVELAFALGQGFGQTLDLIHLRKIAGQADHLAGVGRFEFCQGFGDLFALAGGDIDPFTASSEEAFEQHFADPAAAAGDQGNLAFQAEEFTEIESHGGSPQ